MHPEIKNRSPWIEKYRPESLDDIVGQRKILHALNQLASTQSFPHVLLCGPPGTGKTSTILAIAKKLYQRQTSNMVLELNASDQRGIGIVRQQIQDFASTKHSPNANFSLIILDEADSLTKEAQNALRRIIEKHTQNTRFCLICNNATKIIPALQSRCTRFRFTPVDNLSIHIKLHQVVVSENVPVGFGGLDTIIRIAEGDLRRALNILQSTHMAFRLISDETVCACTGNPLPADIENIVSWLFNAPFSHCYKSIVDILQQKGIALVDIVRNLHGLGLRLDIPTARMDLMDFISDVEYSLAHDARERLKVAALVGSFVLVREGKS